MIKVYSEQGVATFFETIVKKDLQSKGANRPDLLANYLGQLLADRGFNWRSRFAYTRGRTILYSLATSEAVIHLANLGREESCPRLRLDISRLVVDLCLLKSNRRNGFRLLATEHLTQLQRGDSQPIWSELESQFASAADSIRVCLDLIKLRRGDPVSSSAPNYGLRLVHLLHETI